MLIFKVFMLSIPVGTRALKVGGSFQASGTVVGNFKTLEGAQCYVFEFDVPAGMLHIYGPSQLEAVGGAGAGGAEDNSRSHGTD